MKYQYRKQDNLKNNEISQFKIVIKNNIFTTDYIDTRVSISWGNMEKICESNLYLCKKQKCFMIFLLPKSLCNM